MKTNPAVGRRMLPRHVSWTETLELRPDYEHIVVDAKTWPSNPIFPDPQKALREVVKSKNPHEHFRWSPSGEWGYLNSLLPKGQSISYGIIGPVGLHEFEGVVSFTDDVSFPLLVGRLVDDDTSVMFNHEGHRYGTWMSYVPQEVWSQRPQLDAATGSVVVGGLGLGWFLRAVALKPEVTDVVLVEMSTDLLDWYGRDVVEKIRRESGKPIRLVEGDVYTYMEGTGPRAGTKYLLDIWEGYSDAPFDKRLLRMMAAGYDVHAWGFPAKLKETPDTIPDWIAHVEAREVRWAEEWRTKE